MSVSSVTYNSNSLTSVGSQTNSGNDIRTEMFQLVNPPSGTANVVVNLSGVTSGIVAGATTFANVDQNNPLGTFTSGSGSTGTPSVSLSASSEDMIFDVVGHFTNAGISVGTFQSEQWDITVAGELFRRRKHRTWSVFKYYVMDT